MDPSAFARFKDPGPGTSAGHEEKQGPQHGRRMKVSSLRSSPLFGPRSRFFAPDSLSGKHPHKKARTHVLVFFLLTHAEAIAALGGVSAADGTTIFDGVSDFFSLIVFAGCAFTLFSNSAITSGNNDFVAGSSFFSNTAETKAESAVAGSTPKRTSVICRTAACRASVRAFRISSCAALMVEVR